MKPLSISLAIFGSLATLKGQQASTAKWNVEIPAPVVQAPRAEAEPVPEPFEFAVQASKTKEMQISQAPEMPDLPPIKGKIKMTIQKVDDPGLPDPPPPLPALPPDDPAVLSRLEELRRTYRAPELVFLSASVYMDDSGASEPRTLLRIYPNGKMDKEVVAWSNVNFLHLCGPGGYRVNNPDGTFQDIGLLMGISPIRVDSMRQIGRRIHRDYQGMEIPVLPSLSQTGPSFKVLEGEAGSRAMDTLEQLHELFKTSGEALKEQYFAREKARAERKAFLLANPPKPEDVTVRVWKRTPSQLPNNQHEESR